MSHVGIICPPIAGHVNPASVLGRSLVRRGYRVTFFHVSELHPKVRAEGLDFTALGAHQFPDGTLAKSLAQMKELKGIEAVEFAVRSGTRITQLILDHAPETLRAAGLDALLVDQNEPAGGSIAEYLGIPFASLCTSLPLNRESYIPPPFTSWGYSLSTLSRLRNQLGYVAADHLIKPIESTLNKYRRRWRLPLLRSPNDSFSKTAQVAQMPRELDFPRLQLPSHFHYTGPWIDDHDAHRSFPFEKLDGRKLIYGSLGTLQSAQNQHFQTMAEACSSLDVQLVLAVGGSENTPLPHFPSLENPIIAHYVPQIELLKRAALTITHAGMNTTVQALHFGLPLIAIPLTHDQPAIAARLSRTGAGLTISAKKLTVGTLRKAICSILEPGNQWQLRAQVIKQASQSAGGAERAVDILEQTVLKKLSSSPRYYQKGAGA